MLKIIIIVALVVNQAIGLDDSQKLNEAISISIDGSKDIEYNLKKDNTYIFEIKDENYLYSFISNTNEIFYTKNEKEEFESRANSTFFENGEKVYANPFSNISNNIDIKIHPVPLYKNLNSFQTINENQNFFIKSEEKSIAYFGSFDRNSKTYISEISEKKVLNSDYIRINDNFHIIEQDKLYHIKNDIYNISVFNKYFYPLNLINKTIKIIDDEINFLYLEKNDDSYTLDFSQNKINKILKLSTKTFNSKIRITKNDEDTFTEINNISPYYTLNEQFNGTLNLRIFDNDAFIEFLSNEGEPEILTDIKQENHITNKNMIIINIGMTQKSFELKFKSDKNFKYSLSLGLSNTKNYYYNSNFNSKIKSENNEETFQYLALFKNINLLENEFLSFAINFEKEENQNIVISYSQYSLIDELLDEDVPEEKCEKIIENIKNALNYYIYFDIAQNPPEFPDYPNYHHRKINLKDEIGKISTKNRKYYELYQEIESILGTTKDLHFSILSYETNNKVQFGQYMVKLPFKFIIKKYGENNDTRLFITKNDNIKDLDDDIKKFIDSHLDQPIKSINDLDPFDYIQNWSKFAGCKSKHCQFSYIFHIIPSFYLYRFPLNYSDIILNEYEFEDNSILRIPYNIIKPNLNENNIDFNRYFMKIMQDHKYSTNFPSIDEIKEKYLFFKGLKKKSKILKNENDKIQWDNSFIYDDYDYFKCRVDEKNHVNVFVQNSFYIPPVLVRGKIFDCVKLFHSNKYPIIIIESYNGGGYPYLSLLLIQLFQMRSVERTFSSYGTSNETNQYFNEFYFGLFKPDTCEIIDFFRDLENITDFYDNNLNISHTKTIPTISILSNDERQALNEFRKEYENSENLKRPTDIIIFTDGFSYSSTSTFIKGIQNIGGAITVGYFGNPKINGTHLFDASQADSGIYDFEGSEVYNNLDELGYIIGGITFEEVFDDSYQGKNPIPREYTIFPVDYRVDIFSEYSDDIYDEFISEGLRIFDLVNKDNNCNPKNEKLLLHHENCRDMELENTHGGYKCGKDGKWNMSECVPYYCDIGYSFDQYQKQCVPDCISEFSHVSYIHEKNYTNDLIVEKNTSYEFLVINYKSQYIFISSEDYIQFCPKICFVEGYDEVRINIDKKAENDFSVKIREINTDYSFYTYKAKLLFDEKLISANNKNMLILQLEQDHVLFLNNIFNIESNKIKYLIYNDEISYQEILDLNEKYFKEYTGNVFPITKNKIYIIYLNYNTNYLPNPVYFSINSIENETISYEYGGPDYLYLQKNRTFKILFGELFGVLKLSEHSLDSEIKIDDNIILNKKNKYYKFQGNNELKITVDKEDTLIEFLWDNSKNSDIDDLDFEKSQFNLTKKLNVIKIPKKKEYKNITFEFKGQNVECSIYQEYTIPKYYHEFNSYEEYRIKEDYFAFNVIEPYNDKTKLLEDEYYYVIISLYQGNLNLKINVDKTDEKKGLKAWHIALIVVGSLLVLLILIFLIICILKRKKNDLSSEKIEEKMEPLQPI